MTKSNYPSLYFDNLSRTASLLEGLMDTLDDAEDPESQVLEAFSSMQLEKKASIDERAATIRSLDQCERELLARKLDLSVRLSQIKNLKSRLKDKTLNSLKEFQNQPFRGDHCQLQAVKTRGKVVLGLHTSKVNISNVIEPEVYGTTDIPSSCLDKVTYYFVKKDALYKELSNGLVIEDAKLETNRSLRIKDI